MAQELYTKYRPQDWDSVIGQKTAVLSIQKALKRDFARTFLLTGPSGVGKTTLARLIAKQVGCSSENILEVDGATHTGIDDMRGIADSLRYTTVDGSPRCVIVDEVHAISKNSFQSLLKILEEPPEGVYWVLCTTEFSKVPQTVKTRCVVQDLKPVPDADLLKLLKRVKKKEKMPIPDEGLDIIADNSYGSPRQALSYLGACSGFKKVASVKKIMQESSEPVEVIELCRMLLASASGRDVPWGKMASTIKSIDVPPETARIIIVRYMSSVMLGGNVQKTGQALRVAEHFMEPFLDRNGIASLVVACANAWADEED